MQATDRDPAKITIIVLDRSPADLAELARPLEELGYRVLPASTVTQAEVFVTSQPVNLLVKGFESGRIDAVAMMDRIRAISPDTQFILCSLGGTTTEAVHTIQHGAFDYLTKPIAPKELVDSVRRALEHQAVVAQNPAVRLSLRRRSEPDIFAGRNPQMQRVAETVATVAAADVCVLVMGESGTGKEIVARAIHQRSARADRPFVAVNCAGLPENLIESELFGHVRGSFTGAITDRVGAFQLAHRGTLFLDEIGDLSPKGQGDLLRVLEDGTFRPIGSTKQEHADARIVAATNRDLAAAVREGKFRADLYYRLNIVELRLPRLQERPEDIPALAESFLAHFCARHRRRPKRIAPAAMQALQRAPWPGNVRQLRNIIERLVVTVRSPVIDVADLPAECTGAADRAALFVVRAGMKLAEVERELIRMTLAQVTSNREEAARALGLSRRTLQYRLRELGLAGERAAARPGADASEESA